MTGPTVPLWWWEQAGIDIAGYGATVEALVELREMDEGWERNNRTRQVNYQLHIT